ncbi:hypothetical protein D3C86_786220 [compost metagenome]
MGKRALHSLKIGPKHQSMRIKRIVKMGSFIEIKVKSNAVSARANTVLTSRDVCCVTSVFLHDVHDRVLPTLRHIRVQLERFEIDLDDCFICQALNGLFQCTQADCAPGANNVGNEINAYRRAHGESSAFQENCWARLRRPSTSSWATRATRAPRCSAVRMSGFLGATSGPSSKLDWAPTPMK